MTPPTDQPLARGLGLWEAVAVNLAQIVGAGVFAIIPLILGVLPGAYAVLAWLVAGVLIVADGMVWAELGAAMPTAGGSYHYLLTSYGRSRWGRLMAFLFVWQILISGPLEVGSGLVAAAQFSTAVSPAYKAFDDAHTVRAEVGIADGKTVGLAVGPSRLFGLALGVAIVLLLYRDVTTLGRLSLVFAGGVVLLLGWVLVEGAVRFEPALAFDTTEKPANFGLALGAGMAFAVYSYFGYYNVCYLGGEVRNPTRTIPWAILVSAVLVVWLFALTHLAITGVVPWREAQKSENLTADFMAKVRGPAAATVVTVLLIGSCFASCFAGLLGYSRVPFAAARDGTFFRWFAAVHPRHRIPHRALLLVGGMTLFWSFFSLDAIITALIVTRILEQFVAQVVAVVLLRRLRPNLPRPWRMWLYPAPCVVALAGWLFVYLSSGWLYIALGAVTLACGLAVFLARAFVAGEWPFGNDSREPQAPGERPV